MSYNQNMGSYPPNPASNSFYSTGFPANAVASQGDMRSDEHRAVRQNASESIQRPAEAAAGYGHGQGQSPYPQRSAENQRSTEAQNAMMYGGGMASSSSPLGPPKQYYTVEGTQYPMPAQHRV